MIVSQSWAMLSVPLLKSPLMVRLISNPERAKPLSTTTLPFASRICPLLVVSVPARLGQFSHKSLLRGKGAMVNGAASTSLSHSSKASIAWRAQPAVTGVGRKAVVSRNASTRTALQPHKAFENNR